jgi:hypothetical protein
MTWPPSTHQDVQDEITVLKSVGQALITGQSYYYITCSPNTSGTFQLTNNSMRVYPWIVPNAVTLSAIGVEVTTAGNAGAVIRLGIYAHDPAIGMPNALVADFGTVAADAVASPEITISQALTPGVYWIAHVPQNAATTAPTVRANGTSWPAPIQLPHTTNGSNATRSGYTHTGTVSAGLPSNFIFSGGAATFGRVYVKIA